MSPRRAEETVTLLVVGVLAREPLTLRLARPSLVLTLEAAHVDVSIGGSSERTALDRTGCLVVPRRTTITLRTRAAASRVALLGFGDASAEKVVTRYRSLGLERKKLDAWLTKLALLPRTVWVHEIVHRYVFEREALEQHDNLTTRFLEIEILKEVGFLFRDRDAEGRLRANAEKRYSLPIERALAWIEAHLFEPCGMKELARRAGASESTLLRSFRRELGARPGEYWRMRRLDESLVLLRSGRYAVGEVALRAGYENPTSFGFAFRERFGKPPSAFAEKRPLKRAP